MNNFSNSSNDKTSGLKMGPFGIMSMIGTDVISILGLVGYVAVAWVIILYRNTTFKNSFFTLVLSMGLSDVACLIIHFLYLNPASVVGEGSLPLEYARFWGFAWQWFNNSATAHIPFIALNRLMAVYFVQTYQNYFSPKNLLLISCFCYTYTLSYSVALYMCSCIIHIPSHTYALSCTFEGTCAHNIIRFEQFEDFLETFLSATLNVTTFLHVRKMDQQAVNNDHAKKEMKLLIQFGVMFVVFTVYNTVFWVIGLWGNGLMSRMAAEWICNALFVLHSSLNPILLMLFGSEIKQALFGCASVGVQALAYQPTTNARY